MATMSASSRLRVLLAIGMSAALFTSTGAAQSPRQDRPRAQNRPVELAVFPELILLPEQVPILLQLPPTDFAPPVQAQDPVTTPASAQPADQAPPVEQAQPQEQIRRSKLIRDRGTTPPSEQTMPSETVRFVETSEPTPIPPQIVTWGSTDFPLPDPDILPKDHPAMGSYYGKAIQVCPAGVAPSACANGQPATALLMTPTLTGDGLFVADDSFTLLPPPFGPHATAHGTWNPTSSTDFTAEYVFLTRTFPPLEGTISGVRARWVAKVLDANTLVGWVNAYFLGPVPVTWTPLADDEFPAFPTQGLPFVTSPVGFIKDPAQCLGAGCPQVFKFTLKRITR